MTTRFKEVRGKRNAVNERNRNRTRRGRRSEEHVVEHMANSNTPETSDIPGFYYDTERKRYFRVPLSNDPSLTMIKDYFAKKEDERAAAAAAVIVRKSGLTKAVYDRQFGNKTMDSFRRSVYEQRPNTVKLVNEYRHPNVVHDSDCLHLVNGPGNNSIGVWRKHTCRITVFDPYDLSSFESFGVVPPSANVTDIAIQKHNGIITEFFYSSMDSYGFSGIITNDMGGNYSIWNSDRSNAIFSVACNAKNNTIATGEENRICLLQQGYDPISVKVRHGSIHSLSYGEDGRGLVAGSHHGTIRYYDTRNIDSPKFTIKTGRRLLCHVRLLGAKDDLYVVCSGYEDYLALIDLRMRKEVIRYEGHVNRDQKVRFDVDSRREVLCCSGQDGRTRTWNLKNGDLIQSIEPPHNYDRRSGNLHSILKQPDCSTYDPDVVVVYKDNVSIYRSV